MNIYFPSGASWSPGIQRMAEKIVFSREFDLALQRVRQFYIGVCTREFSVEVLDRGDFFKVSSGHTSKSLAHGKNWREMGMVEGPAVCNFNSGKVYFNADFIQRKAFFDHTFSPTLYHETALIASMHYHRAEDPLGGGLYLERGLERVDTEEGQRFAHLNLALVAYLAREMMLDKTKFSANRPHALAAQKIITPLALKIGRDVFEQAFFRGQLQSLIDAVNGIYEDDIFVPLNNLLEIYFDPRNMKTYMKEELLEAIQVLVEHGREVALRTFTSYRGKFSS